MTWQKIIPYIFYMLPESFLLILAATGLLGLRIRPVRLFLAGTGLWILSITARSLLFNTALHTPIILIGLTFALFWGAGVSYSSAITGCFLSFFLLVMGELLIAPQLLAATRNTIGAVLDQAWLHVAFGWVSASFLIIAIVVCRIGKVTLIKAPECQHRDK